MVKRLLIVLLFSVVINIFAVEYKQPYAPAHVEHNHGNRIIAPKPEFGRQPFGQYSPFSQGVKLRAGILCPMCDGPVVDGVCQDCGYILGTATGTESSPIGDGLWILSFIACMYFYYWQKRRKKKAPTSN